jgi:hypothetical protein
MPAYLCDFEDVRLARPIHWAWLFIREGVRRNVSENWHHANVGGGDPHSPRGDRRPVRVRVFYFWRPSSRGLKLAGGLQSVCARGFDSEPLLVAQNPRISLGVINEVL